MTMTQSYCRMMRRYAGDLQSRDSPVKAECLRQAALHMEKLQTANDAAACPWQGMRSAPKDGTAVLLLLNGSDIPHGARWLCGTDDPHATEETAGPGWHLTWDGTPVADNDGPRYWMACPDDPDL